MPLPPILYLALKSILVNRLQKILYCSGKISKCTDSVSFAHLRNTASQRDRLSPNEISVNRAQENYPHQDSQIWYVSAIALRLQKSNQGSAVELASEIADALNHDIASVNITIHSRWPDKIWRNYTAQGVSPGWIHLKLNAAGLHEWLNAISHQLPLLNLQTNQQTLTVPTVNPSKTSTSNNVICPFTVLSTHARSCTLLRLGMQEQLIQLKHPDATLAVWQLNNSDAVNWLDADGRFRCIHVSEWQLLVQIVDTLDSLACLLNAPSSERLWKLAYRLSQAFQAFHANCCIFGAVKTDDRALAQARLGLVFLTQALLHWILQIELNISPPTEL